MANRIRQNFKKYLYFKIQEVGPWAGNRVCFLESLESQHTIDFEIVSKKTGSKPKICPDLTFNNKRDWANLEE